MKLSTEMTYWKEQKPDEWRMHEFIRQVKELESENEKLKMQVQNIREHLLRD